MKNARCFYLFIILFVFSGCAPRFMVIEEPAEMPPPRLLSEKPKVTLALGGGAFHGIAHLGVLKVLEDAGIPIDLIIGASAGSLVGGIYASRPYADSLLDLVKTTRASNVFDFSLFRSREGFVEGKKLQKFVDENARVKNIEDTKIPFIAMVTDLIHGKSIPLESGPLAPSINASSAIPGIFEPVVMYGITMVDGGVLDNVPVDVAIEKGSEVIIAVNIMEGYGTTDILKDYKTIAFRGQTLANYRYTQENLKKADVVITPELAGYSYLKSNENEAIYEAGLKSAKEALPEILKILKEKGIKTDRNLVKPDNL